MYTINTQEIRSLSARGGGSLDDDTYVNSKTFEASQVAGVGQPDIISTQPLPLLIPKAAFPTLLALSSVLNAG